MKADTKDALREQFKASLLLAEWDSQREVASAAVFLASNESS
jgi:hypothetical protein